MGIDVQLRSESGEVLDAVGDVQEALSRAARRSLAGTRLLKYVVPWGYAIFNQAQAADLADDIRIVKNANPDTPLPRLLCKIEPLVEKLSRGAHIYLWFIGD